MATLRAGLRAARHHPAARHAVEPRAVHGGHRDLGPAHRDGRRPRVGRRPGRPRRARPVWAPRGLAPRDPRGRRGDDRDPGRARGPQRLPQSQRAVHQRRSPGAAAPVRAARSTTTTTPPRSSGPSSRPSPRQPTGPYRSASRSGAGRVERVAGNRRPKLPDGTNRPSLRSSAGGAPSAARGPDRPRGRGGPLRPRRRSRRRGDPLYSCHPTASGLGIPTNVSADFVGHGRTAIERDFGVTCVFLQGCAGNQGTGKVGLRHALGGHRRDGRADSPAASPTAMRVRAPCRGRRPADRPRPTCSLELDPFPPAGRHREAVRAAARASGSSPTSSRSATRWSWPGGSTSCRQAAITAIAFGPDLALVVLPGEVFLEHGLAIRAALAILGDRRRRLQRQHPPVHPDRAAFPDGRVRGRRRVALHPAGRGRADGREAVRLRLLADRCSA